MRKIKFLFLLYMFFTFSGCTKVSYIQNSLDAENKKHHTVFKDAVTVDKKLELAVEGKIPSWLNGTMIRNGPGKFNIGEHHLTHWFDGFAMLISFDFKKGKLYYKSAFLESDQYLDSIASNTIKLSGYGQNLGELPAKHISIDGQKVKTANANINLEKIVNHYVAFGETPLPIEFELSTLNTKGIFDYNDKLKKASIWESAHLKRDPIDGTIYNFYTDYGRVSAYVLYKIVAGETKRDVIARQEIQEPSYMHDFSITENYIILTAYPLVVNPIDLLKPKFSFMGAHRWEPKRGTRIYVFDKKNGKCVSDITTLPIFAFHHINAFEEENNKISLLLSANDNAEVVVQVENTLTTEKSSRPNLRKLVIDIQKNTADLAVISEESYEMPRIRDDLIGKQNRYFYAVWYSTPRDKGGYGLVKYDIFENKAIYWNEKDYYAGEPIFIANPRGKNEDDGVIITMINTINLETYLLILDAITMQEIARAQLPQQIPRGLHGKFFK